MVVLPRRTLRMNRRGFVTAVAAGLALSPGLAHPAGAQTPAPSGDSGWQAWSDNITAAPEGPVRWRALSFKATPISEASYANRRLGFVWNHDGRASIIVDNATRGTTQELDRQTGDRAASFNHEQDLEARGLRDEQADIVWPYRYFNFDLISADAHLDRETRIDAEIRGWSEPFTFSEPEARLAFGAITIGLGEKVSWVPVDGETGQQPVFAMCLEGRFTPTRDEGIPGPDRYAGKFVEFLAAADFDHLYGSEINNVLVGVCSPDAGEFVVEPRAS